MRFFSDLTHINKDFVIVKVICWNNNEEVGSTLVQANTVEEAESKGIQKLKDRLTKEPSVPNNVIKPADQESKKSIAYELDSSNTLEQQIEKPKPPSDWSNELAEFNLQVKRIGWSKEEETEFLKTSLGILHRNKITDYTDIEIIILLLREIKDGARPSDIKHLFDRNFIIGESNKILSKLNWSTEQARNYLFNNYRVKSRSELSQKQLIKFHRSLINMID